MQHNNSGPAPGGVGSPSKNIPRNPVASSPNKNKASALPTKKKKKASNPGYPPIPGVGGVGGATAAGSAQPSPSGGKQARKVVDSASSSARESGASGEKTGGGEGTRVHRESRESGGCWGSKGKVVVAVSRRVSVLRVSTAGSRR